MNRFLLVSVSVSLLGGLTWLMLRKPDIEPVLVAEFEPEPQLSWIDWVDEMTTFPTTTQVDSPQLNYFSPAEFGEWWPLMDTDLLAKLDRFRDLIKRPIKISPVPGALGRHLGDSGSYHNVDKHGAVRAVDIFPQGLTTENAAWYVQQAEKAGLGGIGLYPHWSPSMGMHLDNGPSGRRWAFDMAKKQVSINYAYA